MSGKSIVGKVVIVTGAASGMGEAAARRFAAEGAKLVLGDLDQEGLAKLADELGGEVEVKRTDVSEMADCEALVVAAVDRFGRVDVVFANAGVDHLGKVDEGPLSDFTKVIETDLYGVVHMNRAAIAELRKSKGCIVNMSSVSGIGGDWNHGFYCAAKGGVTNFTRALAMDEARNGVRVNAVNPSLVYTALTSGMKDQPELIAKFEERIPMGRGAQPEDIAGVIVFLASDDARFVTGVNLPIDGGLSAANGQPPLHRPPSLARRVLMLFAVIVERDHVAVRYVCDAGSRRISGQAAKLRRSMMTNDEHKPRVDAMTDEAQTEKMQPAAAVAQPKQPSMNDAAGKRDDEETHVVRQDIAETPPAG